MNCPQDHTGDIHCSPQAFSDYLRKLATCHKSINHTAEEPHFFRGELEEFFVGFRDRLQRAILL